MVSVQLAVFWLSLLKWCVCNDSGWHIEAHKNPECPDPCEGHDIWYIWATNATSSVHSLICASKSYPEPTVLIVHSTDNHTKANFNWTISNTSITPSMKIDNITQSYSILLHKLIEYNDESDNVTVSWVPLDEKFGKIHHFADFQWESSQTSQDPNSSLWQFNYTGTGKSSIFTNSGNITFKVTISRDKETNPQMPHLKFIPGLQLQFELALNNLTTNFSNGRFATQLALISSHNLNKSQEFRRESRFSIDDEITPGTFEVINLKLGDPVFASNGSSPRSGHIYPPAYLQTKPICFTDSEHREIKTSRDVLVSTHQDEPIQEDYDYLQKSVARAWYGNRLVPDSMDLDKLVGVRLVNISYGTVADGFYSSSHHLVWAASFGLGEPPVQKLSPLIVGLIVLSILIVICSIIFGTLLVLIIRARQHRRQFSLLRESESNENLAGETSAL